MSQDAHTTLRRAALEAKRILAEKGFANETAFLWFHRLIALKMLESRKALAEYPTEDNIPRLCTALQAQGCAFFASDAIAGLPLADVLSLLNEPSLCLLWCEDETLGRAYEYFNEAEHQAILAQMRGRETLKASQVATATRFYTPLWIVQALVENSLGRLWVQWHPDSQLAETMDYLVWDVESPITLPKRARDITVLDPACGTMHFGLVAFDLLAQMYQEEIDRAGEYGWPDEPSVGSIAEIPSAILAHNLFGCDIDQGALQLAAVALFLKAKTYASNAAVGPCSLAAQDFLQSEDTRRYDVVMGNPPYLKSAKLPQTTRDYLKQHYPNAKADLSTAFMERSISLLASGGRLALVTSHSFLFLSSYIAFRAKLLRHLAVETMLHLGTHAFPNINGEVMACVAFIMREEAEAPTRTSNEGIYFRLVHEPTSETKRLAFEQTVLAMRATHFFAQPKPTPISLARRRKRLPTDVEQLVLFG